MISRWSHHSQTTRFLSWGQYMLTTETGGLVPAPTGVGASDRVECCQCPILLLQPEETDVVQHGLKLLLRPAVAGVGAAGPDPHCQNQRFVLVPPELHYPALALTVPLGREVSLGLHLLLGLLECYCWCTHHYPRQ